MHSVTTVLSALCLATSALAAAQYGSNDYGSGYGSSSGGSSTDASGTGNGLSSSDATPDVASASSPATSSDTPNGMVNMHVVKVSNKNGDLMFEPNNLQAEAGSMVQFQFWPKVHTYLYTQSALLWLTNSRITRLCNLHSTNPVFPSITSMLLFRAFSLDSCLSKPMPRQDRRIPF